MIYFNFILKNPFSNRWEIKSTRSGLIGQNKAWEFNTYKTAHIIGLDIKWDFKTDHAGLQIMIGIFGRDFEFNLYDRRHWDSETNTWAS